MQLTKALTFRQLVEAILALPEHEQREPAFVNSPLFFGPVVSVGHLGHVTEPKNAAGQVFGEMSAVTPVLHVPTSVHP